MTNIFSVDVEDYPWIFFRNFFGRQVEVSPRVAESTREILDLLTDAGVTATFFCLGAVAQRFPELIREISKRGFEVASHGMNHLLYRKHGIRQIESDLIEAKKVLEDIVGCEVAGFRAPHFSVDLDRVEVIESIIQAGYRYDSSIFPISGRRYGSPTSLRGPYCLNTPSGSLIEFPLATVELAGRRLPIAGGGYLRHFPYRLSQWGIKRLNGEGFPAVVYVHPYECDIEPLVYPPMTRSLISKLRAATFNLAQYHGRGRMIEKIKALIQEFEFKSVSEVLTITPIDCLPEMVIGRGAAG